MHSVRSRQQQYSLEEQAGNDEHSQINLPDDQQESKDRSICERIYYYSTSTMGAIRNRFLAMLTFEDINYLKKAYESAPKDKQYRDYLLGDLIHSHEPTFEDLITCKSFFERVRCSIIVNIYHPIAFIGNAIRCVTHLVLSIFPLLGAIINRIRPSAEPSYFAESPGRCLRNLQFMKNNLAMMAKYSAAIPPGLNRLFLAGSHCCPQAYALIKEKGCKEGTKDIIQQVRS